jgi:AcrR family transcriptional regulator
MTPAETTAKKLPAAEQTPVRTRILGAAFSAFTESGYAQTSTLEIATRAHVSKRALYTLVSNKQELLVACISERAQRLTAPPDLPQPRDKAELARVLVSFGSRILSVVSDPPAVAMFRLAIAEAVSAPEVAKALDTIAIGPGRAALRNVLAEAQDAGLLKGQPAEMAERFSSLLWGDLMIRLLLQIAERPKAGEISRRAGEATTAFLQLYSPPDYR